MKSSYSAVSPVIVLLLCATLAIPEPALADGTSEALEIVNKAKFDAVEIPKQAEALVRLAWIDEPQNPEVPALARQELAMFGKRALAAFYDALTKVDLRYTADVVAALIESRTKMISGAPNEYISVLDQAIWFGSVDAKRLAIKEITRFQYKPAMLPMIDSAIEYPVLTNQVITALCKLGDDRARFYLDSHLRGPDRELRMKAAECLATIGNNAIETLREAISSDNDDIRHAAIEAIVPHTTLNDLTILHEYVYMHPDDDPRILQLVRDRAILLETLMEQSLDEESDPYGIIPE